MRLVAGAALIVRASSILRNGHPIDNAILSAVLAGSGIALISGLWTPVAGIFVVLCEIWHIGTVPGDPWIPLLMGTIGGALAMLGPGLWSIDAFIFGWKRIDAVPRKTSFSD